MIYTFYEQVIIIIQFIILGGFAAVMIDLCFAFQTKNKIINIIIQLLFWIVMTFIICESVLVISDGYLPLYTFLFFILGYWLYTKLLRLDLQSNLKLIKNVLKKYKPHIMLFIYPKEVIDNTPKIWRFLKNKLKKIFKKLTKRFKIIFKKLKNTTKNALKKIFKKKKKIDSNLLEENQLPMV